MSHNDSRIRAKLADHPRLIGLAFAVSLLVSQAGVTLAQNTVTYGP